MEKNTGSHLGAFWKASDAVLNGVTVLLLANIFVMMLLQIIMRFIFNDPLTWSEEIARLSLFWMAFLGSVIAVREKSHICVDLIVHKLPGKVGKHLALLTNIMIIGFLVVLFVCGINYVKMNFATRSLVTGIRKGLVYTVIPISAAWMVLYEVKNTVEMFTRKEGTN